MIMNNTLFDNTIITMYHMMQKCKISYGMSDGYVVYLVMDVNANNEDKSRLIALHRLQQDVIISPC